MIERPSIWPKANKNRRLSSIAEHVTPSLLLYSSSFCVLLHGDTYVIIINKRQAPGHPSPINSLFTPRPFPYQIFPKWHPHSSARA